MSISLLSCSNINHELTEFSINKSCDIKKFDEILVFSDKPLPGVKYKHIYHDIAKTIMPYDKTTNEPMPLTLDTYNDFLFKILVNYVNTEHVLSIHYDGFGVNEDEWSDEFLEYDYIGSPTHRKWYPLARSLEDHGYYDQLPNAWYTGGGGFSLRSKKLLMALQDPQLSVFMSDLNYQRCEDWNIAVKYKEYLEKEHKIKFAPLDISMKFSTELLTGLNFSYGFHGWDNIPLFLTQEESTWFLQRLKKDSLERNGYFTRRFNAMCWIQGYDDTIQCLNQILDEIEKNKRDNTYSR
jgi:hypothetical protein